MANVELKSTVTAIFAGGTGILGGEGQRSGIFKNRSHVPVAVSAQGIAGDVQVDRRVHGGPEKAIHHFAAESYKRLAQHFPDCEAELIPGAIGENLSTDGLTEWNVHIGDVFRIGTATVQVSQPRSPCWKINHRFNIDDMSLVVAKERITGWYYRVLGEGVIAPGDVIELTDRTTDRFSIDAFWRLQLTHRPDLEDLEALIAVPGLADGWKLRLTERLGWLRRRHATA